MQPMTQALVHKAEMAFATAERELAAGADLDAVCHHARAAAERYLRARLVEAAVPFPESTSHLVVLLELCLDLEPDWDRFRSHLRWLTTCESAAEEPGHETPLEDAEACLRLCGEFREAARSALDRLDL